MRTIAKGMAPAAGFLLVAALVVGADPAPPSYRHDAEDGVLRWRLSKPESDAPIAAVRHVRSDQTAHSGRFSEHVAFTAGNGTRVLLSHDVGQARVLEELRVSVWVNANRPGAQLIGRVVLPESRDPETGKRVTAILYGDNYSTPGQWQRLMIRQPQLLLERQQPILNRRLRQSVSLRGAYLDEVAINAYSGSGRTEVYLDDLEVVPFVGSMPSAPLPPALEASVPLAETPVEIRQGQLLVNGRPALLRAVPYRGESVEVLRAVGFNAVWFDPQTDPKLLGRAHDAGLWVITSPPDPATVTSLDESPWNGVLLWHLGTDLDVDELERLESQSAWLRRHDPRGRPITATVAAGLLPFSRLLDTLSVRRESFAGAFDVRAYRDWLEQRTRLTRAGTPVWTWIPTEPAPSQLGLFSESPRPEGSPSRSVVEPEQIRLFTYAALAAGIRGLGFWSTHSLEGDDPATRERMHALGLLNLELRLIDGLLGGATRTETVSGTPADVQATLFRTSDGAVLLASWYGKDGQFVPGQAAGNSVTFLVPGVPESTKPWLVSLAGIEALPRERIAGGVSVTLKEFGLTGIVLFSNDYAKVRAIRRAVEAGRREAAQFALTLAEWKFQRVERIDRELSRLGHPVSDARALIARSRNFLATSQRDFRSGNHESAYLNAERALRPLRLLERAHWETAVKPLRTPLSSPYATSFSTLPEHWRFVDRIRQAAFGMNQSPEADFENVDVMAARGWAYARQTIDGVDVLMELSPKAPRTGAYCLRLAATPTDPKRAPAVPEIAPVRVIGAPIAVQPGDVVRLSGWVRVDQPITGSLAGATFADSIGGDSLALHWRLTRGWEEFVVYRPVSQSGELNLTLALTGFGEVCFDDLAVQVLETTGPTQQAARKER